MVDGHELSILLSDTAPKVDAWRAQGKQLQLLLEAGQISGSVSDSLLESVEQTCGAIYSEVQSFSGVIETVRLTSPEAAAQLAPVEDALRLVLMEITELGTEMYAVRSHLAPEYQVRIGPPT